MANEVVKRIRLDPTNTEKVLSGIAAGVRKASGSTDALQKQLAGVAKTIPSRMGAAKMGVEKMGAGLGGPIGGLVGLTMDLGESIVGLGTAFGPVGIAAGALAGGFVLATGAAVALAAAAMGVVKVAGDAAVRLEKLKGIVPFDEAAVGRVKQANQSFVGLTTSLDLLAVAMGDNIGGPTRRVVNLFTAGVLATRDLVNAMGRMGETGDWLIDFALRPLDSTYALLIDGAVALNDLLGLTMPDSVRKSAEQFSRALRPTKQAADSFRALEIGAADYLAQAEALNQSSALADHLRKNQEAAEKAAANTKAASDRLTEYAGSAVKATSAAQGLASAISASMDPEALRQQQAALGFALADDRNGLRNALAAEQARLSGALATPAMDRAAGRRGMTGGGAGGLALSAGQAVVGGDLGGLAALAGPGGAIASAIIGGLQSLGEQGAAGVGKALEAQGKSLIAGIQQLPALLSEVIPDFVSAFVPALIGALVESLPSIMKEAFLLQFRLTKELFTTIPEQIGESMGRALAMWWENAKEWIGQILTGQWRKALGGDDDRTARDRAGRAARIGAGILTAGASEAAIRGGRGLLRGAGGEDRTREAWRQREDRGDGSGGRVIQFGSMFADADAFDKFKAWMRRNEGRRVRG